MLGMGWSEIMVVAIVALIVVGPKDLPGMFRAIGQFTGKAKGMARDFSRAMEAAADESGVRDIAKTIKAAANPAAFGADKLRTATGLSSTYKPGGATEALSRERAETKARIGEATAKAALDRKAREAAAETAATDGTAEQAAPVAGTPPPVRLDKPAVPKAAQTGATPTPGAVLAKPATPKRTAPKRCVSKSAEPVAPVTAVQKAPKTAEPKALQPKASKAAATVTPKAVAAKSTKPAKPKAKKTRPRRIAVTRNDSRRRH